MDDELDLPDNADGDGTSYINSLFSGEPRTRSRRETSSAGTQRRPTVTFQDQTTSGTGSSSNPLAPPISTSLRPSTTTERPASAAGSFLDLFSSTPASTAAGSTATTNLISSVGENTRTRKPSRRAPEEPEQQPTSSAKTSTTRDNAEIEQLRREISNLRYERNELQQTINELHKQQSQSTEIHEREIRTVRNEHREELERLKQEHHDEVTKLHRSIEDDVDVVRNVKRQEDQLVSVQSRLENVTFTLNGLRDAINSMGNYNDAVNRIVDLADEQIGRGIGNLHSEMSEWEKKRQELLRIVESEVEALAARYTEEIVEGRRWLEEERRRVRSEQNAFQQEQLEILTQIDTKRAEMEQYRTDFITKEHDLLVRVVNEREQLNAEKRDFQRQRNADVLRMREEAEHLERCLIQVEQAHQALERTRKELDEKHRELDELHEQLVEHETNYWRNSQGLQ
ncbi:hypothetical protein M3Y98_00388500 [Aphelenchoides besseyi]|nr:hypothetical protein M3Y98_00388500 [Aphelenchoides besseyi]